ncbi:hypothetical protein [Streptomyces lavendulae]|uniref:hypothetical protein n=1 Tax=Streptomyces lavendulae TaxID=1914 RepID=UPI0031EAB0E3
MAGDSNSDEGVIAAGDDNLDEGVLAAGDDNLDEGVLAAGDDNLDEGVLAAGDDTVVLWNEAPYTGVRLVVPRDEDGDELLEEAYLASAATNNTEYEVSLYAPPDPDALLDPATGSVSSPVVATVGSGQTEVFEDMVRIAAMTWQ